jgi:NAD(P)-dependent dehydrogenase (short-subunit alcohol dehydrogenase family)
MSEQSARTAIVTGAAHGIGLATAQRLRQRGVAVAAVGVDADKLAAARLPTGLLRVVADIADDPNDWVARVEEQIGTPSVLVNNAAHEDNRSFLELPIDAVRRSLDATLFGTWALTRLVVGRMIDQGIRGSIVFNLSLDAQRVRLVPSYSVAKAGLAMLIKELANELGPHDIRVNAVSPGAIDPWSDHLPQATEIQSRSEVAVPLGRLGHADDIAKAIDFLTDDTTNGYITGANLAADGPVAEPPNTRAAMCA